MSEEKSPQLIEVQPEDSHKEKENQDVNENVDESLVALTITEGDAVDQAAKDAEAEAAFQEQVQKNIAELRALPTPRTVVLVNGKSGGQQGKDVLKKLPDVLKPCQLYNVMEGGPRMGVLVASSVDDVAIVVAGGDGTVGWVLNTIRDLNIASPPSVAPLPLGTGNDLAQVLGWGKGLSVKKAVQLSLSAHDSQVKPAMMDRWIVDIAAPHEARNCLMNNYFSIGVDAAVALRFHNHRESKPQAFSSQFRNRMHYLKFSMATMTKTNIRLDRTIELTCDGRKIPLPKCTGIIILNLPSHGGGANIWGKKLKKKDRERGLGPSLIDDTKFEVLAVKGLAQLGMSRSGTRYLDHIGQFSQMKITWNAGPIPVQVDGEPWLQEPTTIQMEHAGQVSMLVREPTPGCC
eukprot:TRINITY_DN41201_c0_g1_i1.p1 TRINITY_DN41201_c0_g1~~TRINITY_DN41201_c0_g1_i1.p1  ORF type:complete len:404 (-),score=99.44 TRINITY_DN41201_c0_g1_i1:253-1464(-)